MIAQRVHKHHDYLATTAFGFRTTSSSMKTGNKRYLHMTTSVPRALWVPQIPPGTQAAAEARSTSESHTKRHSFLSPEWHLHPCELYLPLSS